MGAHVAVVGAGPVGLMLACELGLAGADTVVYEATPAPSGESRALGFTRRVAELLDQRGLLARLGELRIGQQGHFGGVGYDLSALTESHHGVLGLPQSRTEAVLAERLAELGVPVRWGHTLVEQQATEDGVTLVLDGPDGRHTEHVAYLVGCDGPSSTVRTNAGIPTTGWASKRGMYMADITGVAPRPRPTGERLPGGHMVLAVPLGDGYYRVLAHDASLPAQPDVPTIAEVVETWRRLTGESLDGAEARWTCAFGNGARLADRYRQGRVLLAGDAAHDTPPLAGWGLSTGIQDAVNLGWKLAAVALGHAGEELLDTYHDERHPLGAQLMRNTHAATTLYLSDREMDEVRSVFGDLLALPDAAEHVAGMVSGVGVRYDPGAGVDPLVGRRVPPDAVAQCPRGSRTRVADLLADGHGVFLTFDPFSETADRLRAGWTGRVDVVGGAFDPETAAAPLPDGAALIRPDGYLAWTGPDPTGPVDELERWFGPARVAAPTT